MPQDLFHLHLTDRETQAVFRALVDYRRILEASDLRDSSVVWVEILAVDSVSEKISLLYFWPAGDRNVVGA